jgi:ATP-dependent helicase HrpB
LQHLAHEREVVSWDGERGMVVGAMERRVGNLVLKSKPMPVISDERRISVLCEAVRNEGLKILGWEEKNISWQSRVLSAGIWRPDEHWPDVTDASLLSSVETWLAPFLLHASKRSDLQRLDLQTMLDGIIPWDRRGRLETLVPSKLEVPSGSLIPVRYFPDGQPPVMEVRLQEIFGLLETPAVNEGKTKIVMHLLSPGYKPVQVTQDLRSFWAAAYHEVRKELRRRYPKHSWPEDPWTAKAVRGARRRTDHL